MRHEPRLIRANASEGEEGGWLDGKPRNFPLTVPERQGARKNRGIPFDPLFSF